MTPIIGCVCGGWIEAIIVLVGMPLTWFLTKLYNKCKRPCCINKGNDYEN